MGVTLKDIAEELNLSKATISRVREQGRWPGLDWPRDHAAHGGRPGTSVAATAVRHPR